MNESRDNAPLLMLDDEAGIGPDNMIVLAQPMEYDSSNPASQFEVRYGAYQRLYYNLTEAQHTERWDAGMKQVPAASITGRVWKDTDYDGVQSRAADGTYSSDEPGLENQCVMVSQWYYDGERTNPLDGNSHWFQNMGFGADHRSTGIVSGGKTRADDTSIDVGWVGVLTDVDGNYVFDNLPTAYESDEGQQYLAAYRLRLQRLKVENEGAHDANYWLATRYHSNGTSSGMQNALSDSDLRDEASGAIVGREALAGDAGASVRPHDGQVILARAIPSARADQASHVRVDATDVVASAAQNAGTSFDWLYVRSDAALSDSGALSVRGGDVGQLPAPTTTIQGILWADENNDGIRDNGEVGVGGIRVTLERYVPDADDEDGDGDGWKRDPKWYEGWVSDPDFAAGDPVDAWDAYDADCQKGIGSAAAGHSQITTAAGAYCFEDVPTQRIDPDGTPVVFAYRVRVTMAPDIRYSYLIAKYHQGDDWTRDSDLRYQDALLMDVDSDEYDVPLMSADLHSFSDNVVSAAAPNNPNHDSQASLFATHASVLRSPAARGALSYGYDRAKAADLSGNDGSVEIPRLVRFRVESGRTQITMVCKMWARTAPTVLTSRVFPM